MKRLTAVSAILFLCLAGAAVWAQQEGMSHPSCAHCGMDRQKFAHSAMMIEYEDGSMAATCSIYCAALDLAINIDKTPKQIQVGDYLTKKTINAETSCWTIGGDVPGVMTKRAKWAFEDKGECAKFAGEHGAQVIGFDEAMKGAYEDMYADTKMIRDKRKAMKEKHQGHQHQ